MVDTAGQSIPGQQSSRAAGLAGPPGVVYAAAVVTWIVATGTAALTQFLTLGLLVIAAPILEAFDGGPDNPQWFDDPRWFVVGAAGVVLALSAAADVVAVFIMRGRRWAQWVLIVLSIVAAVGGAMAGYLIAPLAVTAAALAVIVLLLLPDARAWFRASHLPDPVSAQHFGPRGRC